MATFATISQATLTPSPATSSGSQRRGCRRVYIGGINFYGGLKAHNSIASLGLPICTQQSFVMVLNSLKSSCKGKGKGKGGALQSTCNAADEIFKIAAIMNGLVLIGVAVGFVLLRIEATLEEE